MFSYFYVHMQELYAPLGLGPYKLLITPTSVHIDMCPNLGSSDYYTEKLR